MKVLSYSFNILTAVGVWRPLSWAFGWKRIMYDCYTVFIITGLYSYAFMEFVDILLSFNDINQFVDGSFMFASVINSSIKAANIIYNRDKIIELLGILDGDLCRSRDKKENIIQVDCNQRVKFNFGFFFCLVEAAVMTSTISSVLKNIPERTLPFRIWVPYYNNSELTYWILYVQQVVIGHVFQAIMCIGNDTLVPGLMLLTCAQLQTLKYRHENLPIVLEEVMIMKNYDKDSTERLYLHELIEHHKTILKFSTTANDLFSIIILIQYTISCYVLCISVYRCASMEIDNPEYPFAIFYFLCMTVQIFYFCWYGNEVILESSNIGESIYKMNWTKMNISTQKDLIMIMQRTTRPIIFKSGKIIDLSVESFKGIMKLSYTAFNVLQQT